jgi:hypothetical protein
LPHTVNLLGDDSTATSLCELALATVQLHPAQADSHATVYKWVNTLAALGGVSGLTRRHWNGRLGERWTYRY